MTRSASAPAADTVKLFDDVVASLSGVQRKGASMPYTSVNGNMFSFVAKDGTVALRLTADDLATFIAKYETGLSVQHGAVQKEYAVVPPSLLVRQAEVAAWFAKSLTYARGLKAKGTTKPAAAKKAAPKKPAAKKPTR